LENLNVDGRIILKAYDKIEGEIVPTGFIWPRTGIVAASCKHDKGIFGLRWTIS
jgi:hypothetical protein